MTPDRLADICRRNGMPCFVRKEEVVIRVCIFCGNDHNNLELSADKGLFHCWVCGKGGTMNYFARQHLGEEGLDFPVRADQQRRRAVGEGATTVAGLTPVDDSHRASAYLERRGVGSDYAYRLNLAACLERDSDFWGMILFPLYSYWDLNFLGYVGRAYLNTSGPKYRMTLSRRQIVGFRQDPSPVHVLVEGVFDGIRVLQAGARPAMMLGSSAPDLQEWAARVPEGERVVVLPDGANEQRDSIFWAIKPVAPQVEKIQLPPTLDPGDLDPPVLRRLLSL